MVQLAASMSGLVLGGVVEAVGIYSLLGLVMAGSYIKKVIEYGTKKHNHTLQTNPRHREEEPHNFYNNNTSLRQ